MRLVEQHIIKQDDPRFNTIDSLAFASKNLWNLANYFVRQSFIFQGTYLTNAALYSQLKATDAYKALPAKVSNQVLIQLDKAWTAFFEAMQAWREHPEKCIGRPNLPKYKPKTEGRNLLVFEMGAIWKADLAYREIAVSQLGRLVETKQNPKAINQVRIVPKKSGCYVVVRFLYTAPVNDGGASSYAMVSGASPNPPIVLSRSKMRVPYCSVAFTAIPASLRLILRKADIRIDCVFKSSSFLLSGKLRKKGGYLYKG